MSKSDDQLKRNWDFKGLKAIFVNTTLKKSPQASHTQGLWQNSKSLLLDHNVSVDEVRLVDHDIAFGVQPDMTEEGWDKDEWPDIFDRIMQADILIVGTPIWLGEKSSVCTQLMERLYASSGKTNDKGQYLYYGKVGGCLITGNEDGAKHCAMNILYSLQHIGYCIPPQADAAWLGGVGPGPSYLDKDSGGPESDFTNRNLTFMTWNLMHFGAMLKEQGGVPAYGNLSKAWKDGERFGFSSPFVD